MPLNFQWLCFSFGFIIHVNNINACLPGIKIQNIIVAYYN
uniref:Uncharacterized protein n=1 Tax=Anguilla anguilla TaxID=7936 RepID=A0A0E9UZD4_ANGAN